jgi:hypothetical protein
MLKTCDIEFISSIHGSERREQRKILKKDLQSAVKYGKKTLGYPDRKTGDVRYKYTYLGIVYITDYTSTKEITSWSENCAILNKCVIPNSLQRQHNEWIKRISNNPKIITSHTVIIVDQSSSMNNSDVFDHRSRSKAVYHMLAEEFTATQIGPIDNQFNGGDKVGFTDVVTLIEMRDIPTIVFQHEPLSWILFNKFYDLWENDGAKSHGNYLPAITLALKILDLNTSNQCALSLYFLSDGKPSDHLSSGYYRDYFVNKLNILLSEKCRNVGERFSFFTVGMHIIYEINTFQYYLYHLIINYRIRVWN